jgi:DNA-binding MarR family transcriptional regulator
MREHDPLNRARFATLYAQFHSPTTEIDCGKKCAPYNEHGVPFCCDTNHTVPTAYQHEWEYLQSATNLWHLWQGQDDNESRRLHSITPKGHSLIACLGHEHCQRDFRSIACRAFPFYPYISEENRFIGLSYYWKYKDRCWVISNLHRVCTKYRQEFIAAFEVIFERLPEEWVIFRYHSQEMRRIFAQQRRSITLLHRDGKNYKLSPATGKLRYLPLDQFPKFGVYKIAAQLPFPDEL